MWYDYTIGYVQISQHSYALITSFETTNKGGRQYPACKPEFSDKPLFVTGNKIMHYWNTNKHCKVKCNARKLVTLERFSTLESSIASL